MAGPLDAIERWMEEAVEGTVQRVFRPELQPVQLAKAAARAMEERQVIGPSGPAVPNHFTIALHPRDFERFARYQLALQRELEKYLDKYARDRGWRPVSNVRVSLAADATAGRGRPRVAAQMLDGAGSAASPTAGPDVELERTARQPRARTRAEPPLPAPADHRGVLIGEGGEQFELGAGAATIGRALENQVVIADTRVSRFHAEVRRQGDRFLVRDLGSTNGTLVADVPVEQRELGDGDVISLGGYRLTFRLA